MSIRTTSPKSKQSGVALMVALMLVFVSTLLGMVVLRSSTLETMMVSNEEIRQRTFHAAESAALEVMTSYDPADLQTNSEPNIEIQSIDEHLVVEVIARQEGLRPIANTSIRLFGNFFYAIEATAFNDDVSAERGVIAGVSQRVPLSK